MRIFPTPPYHNEQELLDRPGEATLHELSTTLRDIRRANIFGLGTWVVKRHLERLLQGWPRSRPIRLLDLATGSADIPEELCRWAQQEGYHLSIVGGDISREILEVATERINRAGFSDRVSFVVCDAARPPFGDGSFDVVVCSLAFHHLDIRQAHVAMQQMARLATTGFIINDIYRSQGAWYMAWALAHITTLSRLTRHDGPASVLRAYTPREMRRIAADANVPVRVYKHPFWRMALVGRNVEGRR